MRKSINPTLSLLFLLSFNCLFGQVNLNNGLIAFYPFSGNANDASGNGHHAIFNNATLTNDRFGSPNNAYYFNGTGSYIQVPSHNDLNPSQISMVAIVYPMGFYQGSCHGNAIINKGDDDLNLQSRYRLRFDENIFSNQQNCFTSVVDTVHQNFYSDFGSNAPITSAYTPFVEENKWYCIVFTFDGSTASFYINGTLISSINSNTPFIPNPNDLFIGRLNNSQFPYWFNGIIDEIRIYNRALNVQEVQALCSQQITGTPIAGVINSYAEVLGLDVCRNAILVNDASAFNIGDTILIAQMKGAIIDSSNTASFGNLLNYRNAGNYELNFVSQKNGNNLVLLNELQRSYDIPDGVVQLVRVPYYVNATVTATLTSAPWNGKTGGILAFNVRDTLVLASDIDVTGRGFSGGQAANTNMNVTNCSQDEYYYPTSSILAAPKGESISKIGATINNGKGAPANAGGGGLDHNSGGGGGGNGGMGGFGGYQLEACTGSAFDNRGIGGKNLNYSNAINSIFLGGGGGAGHCNQVGGINMNGGNGAGIIIIQSNYIMSNGNRILAMGANAVQCNLPNINDCHDGNGGGGAGGTILINTNNYLSNLTLDVTGGKGADLAIFNNIGGGRIGPGAGGGGGVIWLNAASLPAAITINNTGGANGVIPLDNNNPWGATPGQTGINLFDLKIPTDTILFLKNIISLQLADSVVSCKNILFTGTANVQKDAIANWQWNFGDGVVINSLTANITHTYANGGTYPAILLVTDSKGCRDSTATSVAIDTITANTGPDELTCINQPANLQGSGGGWYAWTPAQFLNDSTLQNPVATVVANTRFYLTVRNAIGCTDTASVGVNIRAKPRFNAPTSALLVCENKPIQLNGNNSNSYIYQWSPATYLNDPASPNPISIPAVSIQYKLSISESICNYDSTFTVNLTTTPSPIVGAQAANDIDCNTPTAQLQASGALSYVWTPSVGLDNPTIANPIASVASTTTFIVTGTNQLGCTATSSVTVKVTNAGKPVFVIPNAFTPNSDGRNDCFGIQRWGNVTIKEFSIFNRWGQQVFTTKNPGACWDGTFKGQKQNVGGYTYVIIASSFCGEIKKTGVVMLIR